MLEQELTLYQMTDQCAEHGRGRGPHRVRRCPSERPYGQHHRGQQDSEPGACPEQPRVVKGIQHKIVARIGVLTQLAEVGLDRRVVGRLSPA